MNCKVCSHLAAGLVLLVTGIPVFVQAEEETIEEIVVVGSRIARQDFEANSPVTTVDYEEIVRYGDITMDQFLNSLPQVNPAGGTTSNNPGNNGQSNVNLRGMGPNRNLVLIDGHRAMPSQSDLSVDINVIPAALVESIEILSGGASAVYGADAVAGEKGFRGLRPVLRSTGSHR
jgi:outer membrane cobalamin receptor